jgi:hypothetical protein
MGLGEKSGNILGIWRVGEDVARQHGDVVGSGIFAGGQAVG